MCAALRAIAKLEGKPPETLLLDPLTSLGTLERAAPAALMIKASTLANYKAALRALLRRLGLLESPRPAVAVTTGPWAVLLERLPAGQGFTRLRAFVRDCAARGIEPDAVHQGTLVQYVERRLRQQGGGRENDKARRLANQWRRASREVPGWPQAVLLPTRQLTRSRPLSAYGPQLVKDVDDYVAALGGAADGDIFSPRVVRPRRPRTIAARVSCIRRILHAASEAGVPMEQLARLEAITDQAVFRPAMIWHVDRAAGVPNKDVLQLGITAISVGQILEIPQERLSALRADAKRLEPPAVTSITPRNAALLDALDDPIRRARLLHLPGRLLREAEKLRVGWIDARGVAHPPRPHESAWLAGTAAAIEILLHCPMRIGNLLQLRIGHELLAIPAPRGRPSFSIRVDGSQVKNRQTIETRLTGDTAALINEYLAKFRAQLPYSTAPWLFPSAVSPDRPRDQVSFGRAISDATHRHVGVRLHPHLFRAFAGALVLERDPHAIDDLRALLGHAGFQTALVYYRRSRALGAAERLAATVAQQRNSVLRRAPTADRQRLVALDLQLSRTPRRRGRLHGSSTQDGSP
jgi:integrase